MNESPSSARTRTIDRVVRLCRCALAILLPALAVGQEVDPFSEHIRSTDPLTPEEERKAFQLPPGFEIQLVVAEPEISKPMNLAFDERGRLWVTCSTEYPFPVEPGRKGRDAIRILEDTDGDGRADRVTTFADDLNIPIGLYPYRGGAIAFSIPHLYHFLDHDGDGRADERRILYGPVGWERDTHGLNNAFRRAFDGWLYVCHGFNNHSTIRGADGSSISLQSGNTYRVRVDGSRIEQYTWGQVNPFGMTFDAYGNFFTADCHSLPLTQLLRGGYYPSFGKPHDGLGFVPPMMSHHHGSTAICGIAYYADQNFPPRYRGNLFVGNVWTCRVNRDSLQYDGSTVTAHEEEDFVRTTDPWFRPVDLQVGPDGALYIADFYNRIIGHYEVPLTHPGRDRHRGRIWRVVYTGTDPTTKPARLPPSLADQTGDELVRALEHPSLTYRTLAMTRLTDEVGGRAKEPVTRTLRTSRSAPARAHALWVLQRLGELEAGDLERAAADGDAEVRVHAMRVLAETREWSPRHAALATGGLDDSNPFVQSAAAEALGQHPSLARIRPLLDLLHRAPESDPLLRHGVRIALRNHLRLEAIAARLDELGLEERDERELSSVSLAVDSPGAGSLVFRYVTEHPDDRDVTARYLGHAARNIPAGDVDSLAAFVERRFPDDVDFQLELLTAIRDGLRRRGAEPGPAFRRWGGRLADALLASTLEEHTTSPSRIAERRQAGAGLVREYRLEALLPRLGTLLLRGELELETRAAVADALTSFKENATLAALASVCGEPSLADDLRARISRTIAGADAEQARTDLADAIRESARGVQFKLAQALAGTPGGAETLLAMAAKGQASPRLLLRPSVREKLLVARPQDAERIDELTADLLPENEETRKAIAAQTEAYRRSTADAARGAAVFEKTCSPCHQIGGNGGLIGPQLDGIGSRGLERLVEDLLDPNRNVDVAFRATTFVLDDGQVLFGLYRRDEGKAVVVADNTGKEIPVGAERIVQRISTQTSLMPENFLETIQPAELYDLLAYLLSQRKK